MNNDHETVLAVLFTKLQAAIKFTFTATASTSSPTLTSATGQVASLFNGLPVFGAGIPPNTYVQSFNATAGTVTLTQTPTQAGTGVSFTTGFLTSSRRIRFWDTVAEMPALFLRHIKSRDQYHDTMVLSATEIEAEIWIYSRAGSDPDAAPDTTLNNLAQCVRAALGPDDPARKICSLGNTVAWCRIEGDSDYDDGAIDTISKAVIPVKILLP